MIANVIVGPGQTLIHICILRCWNKGIESDSCVKLLNQNENTCDAVSKDTVFNWLVEGIRICKGATKEQREIKEDEGDKTRE